MKAPAVVQTERLLLTRPVLADAADVFARYASDPEITRFLGWPRHASVHDTEAFVAFSDAEWERWPAGPYLIRRRRDAYLLGSTGLSFQRREHALTGYVLAKDAWGQGYATEAQVAMVRLARDIGVRSLEAYCHAEHAASWHVLEKCGFSREPDIETNFPNLGGGPQPARRYRLRLDLPREIRQVDSGSMAAGADRRGTAVGVTGAVKLTTSNLQPATKEQEGTVHPDTKKYNQAQAPGDRSICQLLATTITRGLPDAENRIWHAHPVWFLDGNPVVGYSKLKSGVRLLFWSGQSFKEKGLKKEGTFKAAQASYTSVDDVDTVKLERWLAESRSVQWDYKNIVRRKGRLLRLV